MASKAKRVSVRADVWEAFEVAARQAAVDCVGSIHSESKDRGKRVLTLAVCLDVRPVSRKAPRHRRHRRLQADVKRLAADLDVAYSEIARLEIESIDFAQQLAETPAPTPNVTISNETDFDIGLSRFSIRRDGTVDIVIGAAERIEAEEDGPCDGSEIDASNDVEEWESPFELIAEAPPAPQPPAPQPYEEIVQLAEPEAFQTSTVTRTRTAQWACETCGYETSGGPAINAHKRSHEQEKAIEVRRAAGVCIHHWIADSPRGGQVHQKCKLCAIEKDVPDGYGAPSWSGEKAAAHG